MSTIRMGSKEFTMSEIVRITHHSLNEALLFLGPPKEDKEKNFCIGVGIVKKIEKGENFDLVKMDFGRGYWRDIVVRMNHARRQIYTLKVGQLAWFFGFMKVYLKDKKRKAYFFARGFQGWYVPKNMDIKKLDPNEVEELTKENESKLDFIDELLKGDIY